MRNVYGQSSLQFGQWKDQRLGQGFWKVKARVEDCGIFKGFRIGQGGERVSHL